MSKNVVICCDGTANEFAKNNTNVVKLYSTLIQDSNQQVSYYHPGLGTMEPAGALTTFSRKVTRLLVNLGRRRTIPPGSQIHHSSYKRAGGYAKRLPSDAIPVP